jgi:hypothetical protein
MIVASMTRVAAAASASAGTSRAAHSTEQTLNWPTPTFWGRKAGYPTCSTLPPAQQDDRLDDPAVLAGIRFHNLCLGGTGGVDRRPDVWRIETQDAIGWQRGTDRFIVINKAAAPFAINNLATSLQAGAYKEIRNGWPMQVQPDGTIQNWVVPARSAVMFVRMV